MSLDIQPEFYVGMQETFSKVITDGEAALYAGLIGDNWQLGRAQAVEVQPSPTRFPVHHLFVVGMIGGLLKTRIPGAGSQCITVKYEFLTPVYSGDRIEMVIKLTEFDSSKRLATFMTNCYNQNKDQVITGQAVMLVST
jgi:acyl dehydratase